MRGDSYSVASASQYIGGLRKRISNDFLDGVQVLDHATSRHAAEVKPRSEVRKSVRFTPSSSGEQALGDGQPGTGVLTHSRHASVSSSSPTTIGPESLPWDLKTDTKLDAPLLLQPVAYAPPVVRASISSPGSVTSDDPSVNMMGRDAEFEGYLITPKATIDNPVAKSIADLTLDTDTTGHNRNVSQTSTSSVSSRRRRRNSSELEIYFTPTTTDRRTIFLSSPQTSPTALEHATPSDKEDELATPKAPSKPSSQIHAPTKPHARRPKPRREKFRIKPAQLGRLVAALAKSRLVQKEVGKRWCNEETTHDGESQISMPILTSASTLYEHTNERFLSDQRSSVHEKVFLNTHYAQEPDTEKHSSTARATFGGITLIDPKIHGSPVRYMSRRHCVGAQEVAVGACSFLNMSYGSNSECTLRVEPSNSYSSTCQVMLQSANQVVDRKSGKKRYLLSADIDVTASFAKAALAELAAAMAKDAEDIEVVPASPEALESPEIDWVAIADELQAAALISETIDTITSHFNLLRRETATPQTSKLLAELHDIKDQHSDFLILRPTAFHGNGTPSSMRLPWVSQRLYQDWYESENSPGNSDAAKEFQQDLVAHVAKHALIVDTFTCHVKWAQETLVLHCVPLRESIVERGDVWACFVRGMVDV